MDLFAIKRIERASGDDDDCKEKMTRMMTKMLLINDDDSDDDDEEDDDDKGDDFFQGYRITVLVQCCGSELFTTASELFDACSGETGRYGVLRIEQIEPQILCFN